MQNTDDPVIFVYRNKDEYITRRNVLFTELKDNIYFSDNMFKLMLYSGIKGCYKILKINDILKKHLSTLTELGQQDWVEDVCWNVFRTVETSLDVLPLRILKKFENKEIEKYIFDIIKNVLIGGDTEGFLTFIEEKNIYLEKDTDFVDNLSHNYINDIDDDVDDDLDDELVLNNTRK